MTEHSSPTAARPGQDPQPTYVPYPRGISTRQKTAIGAAVGILLLGAAGGYIAWRHANDRITGSVISYQINGLAIDVEFGVHNPTGRPAMCTLRAKDADGTVVATAVVLVAGDREDTVAEYTLEAHSMAISADVARCTIP